MSSPPPKYCCDTRPASPRVAPGEASGCAPNPPAKTRVLFVDDELPMLRILTVGMRSMSAQWDMQFASSGEEALALARQKAFDVVVTDMRMPGMNGAQLLNQILRLHPQTIRIVLSGYADLNELVSCVGLTHQFLGKPCSLDDLRTCLKRVTEVKNRLNNDKLCELIAGIKNLPSVPELYLEIADAIQSPSASAQRIAELAEQDPALCARVLQLCNSAYFGLNRKVFAVDEAVQLIGVASIQSLALAVPIFSAFDGKKIPEFSIEKLWRHSTHTGALGRRIFNKHMAGSHLAAQSFAAGILHDIGKLILADNLPEEYAGVLAESSATGTPLHEVEHKHFHATHADVGAYLLALWGLPIPLVEAVACHHHPQRCGTGELCLAGVVHIANALQHMQSSPPGTIPSPVNAEYLQHVKLTEQFEAWHAETTAGEA